MPFALIVLSGDTHGASPVVRAVLGPIASALAFLLVGAGMHTTQTVGLALATDLAPPHTRSRVVTLMCVMLLFGMLVSAVVFGRLLSPFSEFRLIQVIQGASIVTLLLNMVALWKQEARDPSLRPTAGVRRPAFRDALRTLGAERRYRRRFVVVGLGTVAFSMQDVLLEPYGGAVLRLPVSATTTLTALLATGGLCGFALAALLLKRALDRHRVAALGVLSGLVAFACVLFAAPFGSTALFAVGTLLIGFGSALFVVGTLAAGDGRRGRRARRPGTRRLGCRAGGGGRTGDRVGRAGA